MEIFTPALFIALFFHFDPYCSYSTCYIYVVQTEKNYTLFSCTLFSCRKLLTLVAEWCVLSEQNILAIEICLTFVYIFLKMFLRDSDLIFLDIGVYCTVCFVHCSIIFCC